MIELMDIYLEQSQEMLATLREELQKNDAVRVKQLAHKWCGSSSTCGMAKLAPLVRQLEHMGEGGNLAGGPALLEQILAEYALVREFIAGFKQSPSSYLNKIRNYGANPDGR